MVFIVAKLNSGTLATQQTLVSSCNALSTSGDFVLDNFSSKIRARYKGGSTTYSVTPSTQLNDYNPSIYTQGEATQVGVWRNGGTPKKLVLPLASTTARPLCIGAADTTGTTAFLGDIGEVLVYDKSKTFGTRKMIECYLAKKWGVDVSGQTD